MDAKIFKKQGFLKYMNLPENSKYSNFESYLENMDNQLIIKPLYQFNRPGRPCKPLNEPTSVSDDKTVTDRSWLEPNESFIEEPIFKKQKIEQNLPSE